MSLDAHPPQSVLRQLLTMLHTFRLCLLRIEVRFPPVTKGMKQEPQGSTGRQVRVMHAQALPQGMMPSAWHTMGGI